MYRFRRIKQYIAAQLSLHPTHRFSIHSVGRRHQGHDPFKYPDPSWLAFFATLVLPWPQPGLNLALPRIQNVFTLASRWNHAPGAITPSAMTFHLHHFFNHGRLYVQYFVHRSLHPRPWRFICIIFLDGFVGASSSLSSSFPSSSTSLSLSSSFFVVASFCFRHTATGIVAKHQGSQIKNVGRQHPPPKI